ncbi:hypothetical protein SEA_ATUIN_235 [Arthrobacter phage Atuin]|nr:hypothetical protein SEA_ATUIN_34 [Arthrobacter phage Atuin]
MTLSDAAVGKRVELVVDLTPNGFDLPKGSLGEITGILQDEMIVRFDDDRTKSERYMFLHELEIV